MISEGRLGGGSQAGPKKGRHASASDRDKECLEGICGGECILGDEGSHSSIGPYHSLLQARLTPPRTPPKPRANTSRGVASP